MTPVMSDPKRDSDIFDILMPLFLIMGVGIGIMVFMVIYDLFYR